MVTNPIYISNNRIIIHNLSDEKLWAISTKINNCRFPYPKQRTMVYWLEKMKSSIYNLFNNQYPIHVK